MKFQVGKNCAHFESDGDFAVFVDGAAYFDDLAVALEQAEHTIYVAGWAIDPRMWLRADKPMGERLPLQTFLRRLVAAKPALHVYLLIWDMSEAYRFSGNPWSFFQKSWIPHRRIRLIYDDHYPFGGCQHQKFIVIDDKVAYCGGIDLTVGRWDTPEHHADDPRRIDSYGISHGPFHDIQARVTGSSASFLGMQFRVRWSRVSMRPARTPGPRGELAGLDEGTAATLAIARTDPVASPPIREIEQISLDLFAHAKESIYIENQYLTSSVLGEALASRLREPDGPEVILVGPRQPAGWVEEITVGILRWRVVDALRAADTHDRLRIYYPMASVKQDVDVYVHAKVTIIDDHLVRIGSANVSRRSLSVDTEMDIIAQPGEDFVRELRHRLICEHLGVDPAQVAPQKSIRETMEPWVGRFDRTLVPLGRGPEKADRQFAQDGDVLFDPEEPFELASLAEVFVGRQAGHRLLETAPAGFATISLVTAALVMWRLFLADRMPLLAELLQWSATHPWNTAGALFLMTTAMLSVGVSTFVALLPCAFAFGVVPGMLLTWVSSVIASGFSYRFGQRFGRNAGSKLFGFRVQEVRKRLFGRGFFSVVALRALPISSFATVGFAAGAAAVPLRTFIVGTLVGVLPNLVFLSGVAYWLAQFMRTPNLMAFLTMVLTVVFVGAVTRSLIKAIERRENRLKRGVPERFAPLK